mgnify:CR=1 FL=1
MSKYFKSKASEWMSLSVPEYIIMALKWLKNEEDNGKKYYRHSYKAVIKCIEKEIITEVADKLAQVNYFIIILIF